jgi:hypothetical protein
VGIRRAGTNSPTSGGRSAGIIRLRTQATEFVVGALMCLSVNGAGRLGYPTASSPREVGIMAVPNLLRHGPVTFVSARVEPMCIKRASLWSRSQSDLHFDIGECGCI